LPARETDKTRADPVGPLARQSPGIEGGPSSRYRLLGGGLPPASTSTGHFGTVTDRTTSFPWCGDCSTVRDGDSRRALGARCVRVVILTVGDLAWDVLAKPDTILLPGGDTTGRIELHGGGSAANFAVWAARCGATTGFCGAVGSDALGEHAVRDLATEGVECRVAWTPDRPTGVVLVLIDRAGQRSMLTAQGADFTLRPDQIPEAFLERATHLHLSAWSLFTDPPRMASIQAVRIVRRSGATISVDPASFQMIRQVGRAAFLSVLEEIGPLDVFFPNADEAAALSGESEPEAAAEVLHERLPGALIAVKLDREGCLISEGGRSTRLQTTEVRPVVDATGAGDAFAGAFVACRARGWSADRAAMAANRVAAWVVARFGARPQSDRELEGIRRELDAAAPSRKPGGS
jgi:ribokinase